MPVSAADGLDVGFADSDPPGVEGAAAAVVLVVVPFPVEAAVVGFVVVAVVVGVVAPPAAVVVVLPPVVVVVDFDFDFDFDPVDEWLLDDFLVADGLDEPQAAAIRPPTATMLVSLDQRCGIRRVLHDGLPLSCLSLGGKPPAMEVPAGALHAPWQVDS